MVKVVKKVAPKKVQTKKTIIEAETVVEPLVETVETLQSEVIVENTIVDEPVKSELINEVVETPIVEQEEGIPSDLTTANVPLSQNASNLLGWLKMYKMTAKQYAEKLTKTHPKKLEEGVFGASIQELLNKGL